MLCKWFRTRGEEVSIYLEDILNAETYEHVMRVIESFRTTLHGHKIWQRIPI